MSSPASRVYEFGPFHLDPVRRLLRRNGVTVVLTPKALEILTVLVQDRDQVLDKNELMKTLWPDIVVEEGNLTTNISLLRKALGEDPSAHQYIVTIPGRGYQFVAPVREVAERDTEPARAAAEQVAPGLSGRRTTPTVPGDVDGLAAAGAANVGHVSARPTHDKEDLPSATAGAAAHQRVRSQSLWAAAIALLALVVVALSAGWLASRSPSTATEFRVRSIAVLPFKPLVAEARDEYLELGMADALITKLSKLQQLAIRPTESILNYASPGQDLQAAGRRLGVDAVITGGVQRTGDRLRVTVQLVRVQDASTLWAERFDAPWSNVFAMQDAISEQVARALALRLTSTERNLLVRRDTENPAAYREYLIGRHFLIRRGREAVKQGRQHFEKAVELDPGYALAHAALADSYLLSVTARGLSPKEAYPRARAAALKALQLNPALAEAHTTLAVVSLYYDWDWVSAERAFKHAIDLKPEDATAHQRYALALKLRARFDDALREIRLARDLDPVSPMINTNVGYTLYWARRHQEAIVELRKALAFDPDLPHTGTSRRSMCRRTRTPRQSRSSRKRTCWEGAPPGRLISRTYMLCPGKDARRGSSSTI